MKYLKDLILAILAGFSIGIGGIVYLACDNKYLGSFLFTIGLFMVCTRGYNLFTGKIGYLFKNKPDYIIFLAIVWIGNFIGTGLCACLIRLTRFRDVYGDKALDIVNGKLSGSLLSIFIHAIFCNILMYIGVDGFKENNHHIGKYLGLVFAITVFIIGGFEHCVADMFYIWIANDWNIKTLLLLIFATFGNIVGGLLFSLLESVAQKCGMIKDTKNDKVKNN